MLSPVSPARCNKHVWRPHTFLPDVYLCEVCGEVVLSRPFTLRAARVAVRGAVEAGRILRRLGFPRSAAVLRLAAGDYYRSRIGVRGNDREC